MSTVYFLGAGASKASDFNLPMMKGFFHEEHFSASDYPGLAEYVSRLFPRVPLRELNLEDVVTHLELSLTGFASLWESPRPEVTLAREEFDKYVTRRLGCVDRPCSKHVAAFRRLKDVDSILTLNYDLVADRSLHAVEGEHSQTRTAKHDSMFWISRHVLELDPFKTWDGAVPSVPVKHERGYYLKLHGSLDWLYCPKPPCVRHQAFFPEALTPSEGRRDEPGSPCNVCGAGLVPVIIPPAMGKSFERFPKMGLVWNLAYRKLRAADRWILIGMSLPACDYYLAWLLRESGLARDHLPAITVVNPDRCAAERAKDVVGVADVTWVRCLDEFIEAPDSKEAGCA